MWTTSVPWWEFILRGVVVYVFLLVFLRLTGKRQTGQFAPFDLVLLLILSNAVQNSMNAGDNSLPSTARCRVTGPRNRQRSFPGQRRRGGDERLGRNLRTRGPGFPPGRIRKP